MSMKHETPTLFAMRGFPQRRCVRTRGVEVRLGIGGNQKSSLACFWHLLGALSQNPRVCVVITPRRLALCSSHGFIMRPSHCVHASRCVRFLRSPRISSGALDVQGSEPFRTLRALLI